MGDLGLLQLAIFATATFTGAVVAGLSGFAFGLIASSLWLYILTPAQTASLIVLFAITIQGVAVWRLRHALKIGRVMPFVLGGAIGVPVGVAVLRWIEPNHVRVAVGLILILFSLYSLARPKLPPVVGGGGAADGAVGLLSGILGGATGLAGILTIIWCSMRGWPRDEQRTVFQPTTAAIFLMIALWLAGERALTSDTLRLFLVGLPVLLLGHWVGLRLYGRLDEARFRQIVLVLLLVSGIALITTVSGNSIAG